MPKEEIGGTKKSQEKVDSQNDKSETKWYTQGVYESLEARKARTGEGSRTKKTRIQKGY
jgi:hypothetical protein